MRDIADLVARFSLSAIFIFEAYDSIKYYQTTLEVMTEYGVNWNQNAVLNMSIAFLVLGSLMILMGYRARLGAFLLLMYWIPVTFVKHSWWNDPIEIQREQSVQFVKNLAIAGGLITLLLNGTARYSIRKLFTTTKF